jgi:hypothetical protein
MTGAILRSLPTGPECTSGVDADPEPDTGSARQSTPAVVIAASLLDFLR